MKYLKQFNESLNLIKYLKTDDSEIMMGDYFILFNL